MAEIASITGVFAAGVIAALAWRLGTLSGTGAVAAALVGSAAMFAGLGWGVLLVAYFVSTAWISRRRRSEKAALTDGIIEKGGRRDAVQVLANGGVFAVAAVAAGLDGTTLAADWLPSDVPWIAIGAGALAASAADSWGTEIGITSSGAPRSLLTGRRVPAGTSGAVSLPGTLATFAGAGFIAAIAVAAVPGRWMMLPVFAGGLAGAFADSLLGATAQNRRWCAPCEMSTEQVVHRCGRPTEHRGGVRWLNNDGVNLAATVVGAAAAYAMS